MVLRKLRYLPFSETEGFTDNANESSLKKAEMTRRGPFFKDVKLKDGIENPLAVFQFFYKDDGMFENSKCQRLS